MTTTAADHRIVLITGANKGIGLATARELAGAGHTVLIGARDHRRGTEAAAELTAQGLDARFVHLDVTDTATIAAAAELIDAEYGRLDTLINNAGVARDQQRTPDQLPVEAMRETYETNVFGVVAVTNAMLPLLRRSPAGYVGNVSSGLASFSFLADPDSPLWEHAALLAYNSSKAALNAVTLVYARVLRDTGIRVNALEPGYCATDLNGHAGHLSAEQGGRTIAGQVTASQDGPTGAFFNPSGGTYPW
ncbi:NAD(P)-dependent dehydrogenase (short-subunit alcohol dehydrogenase family) [Kitasatospora sp. MAA19]|uniref:SDR family oxidoreductase n=1 Tax=Kitasatospora sp. MAA19 TaxID=3035090 RepID=UPI00247399C6|nr:SDR family oxidoreductase [Kitasatospora sp. MAA19]MDH6704029.1 NAD(P)-dependent dehydrogenase (short-subunit alcohol dehydrogenase family) [Kitasatospora sp. MAA19]